MFFSVFFSLFQTSVIQNLLKTVYIVCCINTFYMEFGHKIQTFKVLVTEGTGWLLRRIYTPIFSGLNCQGILL